MSPIGAWRLSIGGKRSDVWRSGGGEGQSAWPAEARERRGGWRQVDEQDDVEDEKDPWYSGDDDDMANAVPLAWTEGLTKGGDDYQPAIKSKSTFDFWRSAKRRG